MDIAYGPGEWPADWIRMQEGTETPLLRKSFRVDKPIQKAVLCGTALGVFELRLNGNKLGDSHLMPGWTDYRKRVYYQTFDVRERIVLGENVLGAILGDGWFAGYIGPFGDKGYYGHDARFSCVLMLEYEDGSEQTLVSGADWRAIEGPVLKSDLLMGEVYDARRDEAGWDAPGFDDSGWKEPRCLVPGEELLPEAIEPFPGTPIRTVDEIRAQSVSSPAAGISVFDMGQNMVGVAELKVQAPAGTRITLRFGEMLNENGTVYTDNLRAARATDVYIAKGGGEEIWTPRFTYHGFRYVQVEGLPDDLPIDTVTGMVWMSGLKETASFECSNGKVNQLFRNIQWGFRGNYLDVPTDCPQRDERLGWTGDTQMFIRSASYLADIRPFFDKWLVDLHDAQAADGGYPDYAPYLGRKGYASAAWADAGVICPHVLWQAYGDTDVIRKWWPQMKKYMELICTGDNRHNGPDAESYGDWLNIDAETPTRMIGLAYRAYDARLMQEMAAVIEEDDDYIHFTFEAEKSRKLFRDAFFQGSQVAVKTQTACALAIAMELLDGDDLEQAKNCLFQCLEESAGYLTTGFVGTGYLCPALTKAGRSDLAVQLLLNEGSPSWLFEVNNGATTIWERWNSWTKEDGFGDVSMNSFNHYAFGAVCEWMFESLAGFRPAAPGFERIVFEPCLTEKFDYVKAAYDSIQGRVSCHWKKVSNGWKLKIETPVPARVILPDAVESVDGGRHEFLVENRAVRLCEV
ncbi:alpha-L-rhamnosidase [Tichowtungia aerotolerans]|uniref:alpha-L-rhamnosidase n=1 Tax=Tichowtungia aerotolerans TaxID=2697043 RepID=A0A6P1M4G1_9BACT|nr:alpha-L-rhamnosidase [Tichowtungia aerotolerans]QHI68721.1 family 78 glycoside hydrolase catalytic domain [Tichowtungia aerotolerans]